MMSTDYSMVENTSYTSTTAKPVNVECDQSIMFANPIEPAEYEVPVPNS